MATDGKRRVKLYVLNKDNQWDDCGTGHVTPLTSRREPPCLKLHVRSEEDGSTLLESEVRQGVNYQKQQSTLIVWSENETTDLALSFQEKESCDEIWNKICEDLGRDSSNDTLQEVGEDVSPDERFEEEGTNYISPTPLPPCELNKLEEICSIVTSSLHPLIRREKLTLAIENEQYISKLIDLFHMCEDLDHKNGLHYLHEIVKHLFLLNKHSLLEMMLDDKVVEDIIGCLEYDPRLTIPRRHREFLRSQAKFKEVIPITNSQLLFKIHQTYRAQFIQDVVIPTPSVFEDNVASALSSLIYFNKVEIVTIVQNDEDFIKTLFDLMVNESITEEKRLDCTKCLKELCLFSQSLQIDGRTSFFKILLDANLLSVIEKLWTYNNEPLKMNSTEILSYAVENSPSTVRQFLLKDEPDEENIFANTVIEQMMIDADGGIATQCSGILRTLLDPENMIAKPHKAEKSEFLNFFYKHCMHLLVAPLLAVTSSNKVARDDYKTSVLLSLVLDLASFCVEHHTYHIKNYVFRKDLLGRVLVLLKSRHSSVILAALRFCRQIIGLKDDFYNRYIVKGNLFEPVIQAFKMNGNRYNIFNSAVLEMFEFVRTEDIKMLCSYIVDKFWDELKDIKYVGTFTGIKQRFDQQTDRKSSTFTSNESVSSVSASNSRYRRDPRQLDEDEEHWFNEDDDDELDESHPELLNTDVPDIDSSKALSNSALHPTDNTTKKSLVSYESDSSGSDEETTLCAKRFKPS